MKKLRVGVIGLGFGKAHIQGYQSHPDAEVVAVADMNGEAARKACAEFNIPAHYVNADEMLAREALDVVSIAVPNRLHKPFTLNALEAGCHVLCEKPMAMNAGEAQDMLDAAAVAQRRIMINFGFRFRPQSSVMKREAAAGTLGNIYYAHTRWLRRRGVPKFGGWFGCKAESGGGALIDLGVHRLDLALWLMDYPKPRWVMARTFDPIATRMAREQQVPFDVEDMAAACITFENGALLNLEASWASNIAERELMETRLMGDKGGMWQRNLDEGYEFECELYIERDGCQFDLRPHEPIPGPRSAMYHFIDCIVQDVPHIASGEEGLVVMQLLDAIYQSAATGEPVAIA